MQKSASRTDYASALAGIHTELMDRQLILSGIFDGKIKELNELLTEADRKLGLVQTVEAAEEMRAEAESYSVTAHAKADAATSEAARLNAEAAAKVQDAAKREASIEALEKKTIADANAKIAGALEKKKQVEADCARRESAAKAREDAVTQRENELAQAKKEWIAKQKQMADALAAARDMATSV